MPDTSDTSSSPATREQSAPAAGEGPAIWEEVFADIDGCNRGRDPSVARLVSDIRARDALGRERYGRCLVPRNGRDQLVDAYQEILDAVGYLACAEAEWEAAEAVGWSAVESYYWKALSLAHDLRRAIDRRDVGEWGPAAGAKDEGGEGK